MEFVSVIYGEETTVLVEVLERTLEHPGYTQLELQT